MDDLERLAEFVWLQRGASWDRLVSVSSGKCPVVEIVLVPTHPLATVGAHQAAGDSAQETFSTHISAGPARNGVSRKSNNIRPQNLLGGHFKPQPLNIDKTRRSRDATAEI